MNKYQKQLHREIKGYMKRFYIEEDEYSYQRHMLKKMIKYSLGNKCDNCEAPTCDKVKNKIIWCKDRVVSSFGFDIDRRLV